MAPARGKTARSGNSKKRNAQGQLVKDNDSGPRTPGIPKTNPSGENTGPSLLTQSGTKVDSPEKTNNNGGGVSHGSPGKQDNVILDFNKTSGSPASNNARRSLNLGCDKSKSDSQSNSAVASAALKANVASAKSTSETENKSGSVSEDRKLQLEATNAKKPLPYVPLYVLGSDDDDDNADANQKGPAAVVKNDTDMDKKLPAVVVKQEAVTQKPEDIADFLMGALDDSDDEEVTVFERDHNKTTEDREMFHPSKPRVVLYGPYCLGSMVMGKDRKLDESKTKWVYVAVIAGGFKHDATVKHHFNNYMVGKQVIKNSQFLKYDEIRALGLSWQNLFRLVGEDQKMLSYKTPSMKYPVEMNGCVIEVKSRGELSWITPSEENAMEILQLFSGLQAYLYKTGNMSEDPVKIEIDTTKPSDHLITDSSPYWKPLYELIGLSGVTRLLALVHGKRQLLAKSIGMEKKYPVGKVLKEIPRKKRNMFLNLPTAIDPNGVNEKVKHSIMYQRHWRKDLCLEFEVFDRLFVHHHDEEELTKSHPRGNSSEHDDA